MKQIKIWSILLLALMMMPLLISCGRSEKDFDEELGQGYILFAKTMYGNALVYDEIKGAWHKAIFDKESPSGKYCKNFDDAIDEILDSLDAYNVREDTKSYNDSLLEVASHLNPPPSSRKDCYDDFVSIVSDVSFLNRMVLNPSGSLKEYREKGGLLFDTIAVKMDKFRIKYGNILPKKAESDGIDD